MANNRHCYSSFFTPETFSSHKKRIKAIKIYSWRNLKYYFRYSAINANAKMESEINCSKRKYNNAKSLSEKCFFEGKKEKKSGIEKLEI